MTHNDTRTQIIVINEDQEYLEGLRFLLQHAGYRARIAHSVNERNTSDVDAFVVHVGIHDLRTGKGFRFVREARVLSDGRPLIVVASVLGGSGRERLRALGVDRILIKPISGRELVEALQSTGVFPSSRFLSQHS